MIRLNLGCGLQLRPVSEGWINVDRLDLPGVNTRLNLFKYPWPVFETDSVDEVYASHLVEHIPHEPKLSDLPDSETLKRVWGDEKCFLEWQERICDLDGFFAFFAEVWRICKKDATVVIVAPYGQSRFAIQDASHTRFIMPNTFAYLCPPEEKENFDYQLPFMFKIEAVSAVYDAKVYNLMQSDPEQAQIRMNELWNQVIQISVTMRVIK